MKNKYWIIGAVCVIAIVCAVVFNQRQVESGEGKKTLRFGAIIAMTGPNADYGLQVKEGIDLAIAAIRQSHPDLEVKVSYEDSATNPGKGLSAFEKLTTVEGHKIIVGNASFLAGALAPIANDKRTLFMALATTMPGLVENRPYVMRHFPTATTTTGIISNYASSRYKKVSIAYVNDDYGKNAAHAFASTFAQAGREVVLSDGFDAKDPEQRSIALKLLDANPDAVFIPGYGPGFVSLIKAIRASNPSIPILGDLALVNAKVLAVAGQAAEGVVLPASSLDAGIASNPRAAGFLQQYLTSHASNPDVFLTASYDAVLNLAKAVLATDGSPEEVRKFLIEKGPHETLTGEMRYNKDGDSELPAELLIVEKGKLVRPQ